VSAGLSTTNIGLVANGGISLVGKLTTAVIMWLGALQVIDNQMTVGELGGIQHVGRPGGIAHSAAGAVVE